MSDDNGNTTSGEYEDEIAMLRDLSCRQSARIERLTAENKQLRAILQAESNHLRAISDAVCVFLDLRSRCKETTE